MHRYQVVVNGHLYTVNVKSIVGSTAVVEVDGWEFHVGIGEAPPVVEPFTASPPARTATPAGIEKPAPVLTPPPQEETSKKRVSALEQTTPKKPQSSALLGEGVVIAHLPGLITEILVKPGDKVKAGDVVIRMEAMKMVNEIRSKVSGTVGEILVSVQDNVRENQPLMVIE